MVTEGGNRLEGTNSTEQPKRLSRYASLLQLDLERLQVQQQQQQQQQQQRPFEHQWTTLFRAPAYGSGLVGGEFCANSYHGWHYNSMLPRSTSTWSLPDSIKQGSSDFLDPFLHSSPLRVPPRSRSHSMCKLVACLILLLLLVGMVIVVLLATIFKVYGSSIVRTPRTFLQYQGHLHILSGPLLHFDAQLLQSNSDKFRAHSRRVEHALDEIFENSALRSIYERSTVTSYRFVIAVPALDVAFTVRFKTKNELEMNELLSTIRMEIKENDFGGSQVDLKSISLEAKRHP